MKVTLLLGLILGGIFGAILQLSGASSHTRITNALRLKDLTIIKLSTMSIGVGLIGVNTLDVFGVAHLHVKHLYVVGILAAGILFGIGFALSGYCPGTALAAAAEGKPDAWMTVLGGLAGALALAFVYPELRDHVIAIGSYGKVTVHGVLGIPGFVVALPLGVLFIWLAWRLDVAAPEGASPLESHVGKLQNSSRFLKS